MIEFLIAALFSFCATAGVLFLMRKWNVIDVPQTKKRKIHKRPIALGGGLAIFISFFLMIWYAVSVNQTLGVDIPHKSLWGLFLGSLVLMIGGVLDDKYDLPAKIQILFPIAAAGVALLFGIGIESISSPSGGVFQLNQFTLSIDGLGRWVIFADSLVFLWLMGMMFTTKFSDGLDGLVTGISIIGALCIFFVTQQPQWYQPEIGRLALLFAGACSGFLFWNFYPAKIFLGEGGSLFTGYVLAILAIISGSKIATTLLVVGVPALDVLRVIIMRFRRKQSVFLGDSEHLHYRLLGTGLSHPQTVILFYSIAILFGASTIFLQNKQQLVALVCIGVLMLLLGLYFMQQDDIAKSKVDSQK